MSGPYQGWNLEEKERELQRILAEQKGWRDQAWDRPEGTTEECAVKEDLNSHSVETLLSLLEDSTKQIAYAIARRDEVKEALDKKLMGIHDRHLSIQEALFGIMGIGEKYAEEGIDKRERI